MGKASNKSSQDTHVFRLLARYKVPYVVVAVLSLGGLMVCLELLLPGRGASVGLILWLLAAYLVFTNLLLPTWRRFVLVDRNGLYARVRDDLYEVFWIEIVATDFYERVFAVGFPFQTMVRDPYLWIATRKRTFNIPLIGLDAEQVWAQVQAHLDPEKVGDVAYERWLEGQEGYQEWRHDQLEFVQSINVPLRACQKRTILAVYWSVVALFALLAVFSIWVFGGFGCLTLYFLTFAALAAPLGLPDAVELDAEKVTRVSTLLGHHQMRWDEIDRVEHNGDFAHLDLSPESF